MPNVDRLGRCSPLALACPLAEGVELMGLLSQSERFETHLSVLGSIANPVLLQRALEQVFCGDSLWWSSGSDRVEPR